MNHPIITGTQIHYYLVCKRKLWLFSRNITMEQNSGLVEMGQVIHESAYARKRKEVALDGIKIDFFEKNRGVIHEVKKSRAIEESHFAQIKYYLWYLKGLGITAIGEIDYPKLKCKENVSLSLQDETEIKKVLTEITRIIKESKPLPPEKKRFCRSCSYYDLCFI